MTRFAWLVLLGGCFLDTQRQDPPPCLATAGPAIASQEFRDPNTGQCQSFGPTCNETCGPCPAVGLVLPDWAMCNGTCDTLPEAQCLANPTCHAAYQDDSAAAPVFWGCWELPPSGAVAGSCPGLDAQTCSENPDCTSLYTGPVNQPPGFVPSFVSCQ